MPHPYFEMEESKWVTPWVNRIFSESPRAWNFLGLRLVKARHKNLIPVLSRVKPHPSVGSGRYAQLVFYIANLIERCSRGGKLDAKYSGEHNIA